MVLHIFGLVISLFFCCLFFSCYFQCITSKGLLLFSTMVCPSTSDFCSVLVVEMTQPVGSELDVGGFLLFLGSKQGPVYLGCIIRKLQRSV